MKLVYNLMLNDITERPHVKNWVSLVKNLLSILGFFHVWVAQGAGDEKIFLSIFRQRVSDHFIQTWQQRLNESSRASFDRHIIFQFQPYLEKVVHKKFRNAISKLRLSSRERIVCAPHVILWRMNFILFFECSVYNDEIQFLIKPYYRR